MDTKMLHVCKLHSQACYLMFDSLYAKAYLADKAGQAFIPNEKQLKALKGALKLLDELTENSKTIIELYQPVKADIEDAELPL